MEKGDGVDVYAQRGIPDDVYYFSVRIPGTIYGQDFWSGPILLLIAVIAVVIDLAIE